MAYTMTVLCISSVRPLDLLSLLFNPNRTKTTLVFMGLHPEGIYMMHVGLLLQDRVQHLRNNMHAELTNLED